MADKPILFSEHVQLTNLGISPDSISFANVTLESENFVCIRENVNGANSVAIVDLNDVSNV
jgi:clathrin heavy chain